jgi:hypothetical protein
MPAVHVLHTKPAAAAAATTATAAARMHISNDCRDGWLPATTSAVPAAQKHLLLQWSLLRWSLILLLHFC